MSRSVRVRGCPFPFAGPFPRLCCCSALPLQVMVLLLLPPPLWLLLLLGGYWLSSSRADACATGCWQGSTGPAGVAAAQTVLFPPPVHVYFSSRRGCSGSRWPPLWLDGRGRWPPESQVAAGPCAGGLVHSPSLTGWYTVCVSSCVCCVCDVCFFFASPFFFNYQPVVAA